MTANLVLNQPALRSRSKEQGAKSKAVTPHYRHSATAAVRHNNEEI